MDNLDQALNHINVSIKNPIDRDTFIKCVKGTEKDSKWKYHLISFFSETNVRLVHSIVLDKIFSFEELYNAYMFWDGRKTEYTTTADWIKEMYFLCSGRVKELDNQKQRFGKGFWNV
ncbi:MAG: hypothetical protein ACOC2M_03665 [bacterium]